MLIVDYLVDTVLLYLWGLRNKIDNPQNCWLVEGLRRLIPQVGHTPRCVLMGEMNYDHYLDSKTRTIQYTFKFVVDYLVSTILLYPWGIRLTRLVMQSKPQCTKRKTINKSRLSIDELPFDQLFSAE